MNRFIGSLEWLTTLSYHKYKSEAVHSHLVLSMKMCGAIPSIPTHNYSFKAQRFYVPQLL
jgi:hypothetical protein